MKKSKAMAEAQERYRKSACHTFQVTFYPKDEHLWKHLEKQPKKAEYMRGLIEQDIEGAGK